MKSIRNKWIKGLPSLLLILTGCQSGNVSNNEKLLTREEERREKLGKLFGEDLVLFGGNAKKKGDEGARITVNSYLWRAALDTVKFMPLRSADPFGGVILTEWYTDAQTPNERFKVDILITSSNLRSDAVRVAIHKQVRSGSQWLDKAVARSTVEEFEDTILRHARDLKING